MYHIEKLYIANYRQFKKFKLDFSYCNKPKKNKPLEKVCFIGKNGTGKSTILDIITNVTSLLFGDDFNGYKYLMANCMVKISGPDDEYYVLLKSTRDVGFVSFFYNNGLETVAGYEDLIFDEIINRVGPGLPTSVFKSYIIQDNFNIIENTFRAKNNENLLINVPSESANNEYKQIDDVPTTSLNEALSLFGKVNAYHLVSSGTIKDFWKTLIYLIKKRDNELNDFRDLEINQDRTLREVNLDFEISHPKILDDISKLWNRILEKAGLEFDVKNASNPIQLNDNLRAYIKLKSTGSPISYNRLSTGIRDYIFKLGHIYSLYFGRNIKQGFLMIDEPENSLFPDFLYDIIDLYTKTIKNTQMFISTHSPIIAAQFEPDERVVLDFDDDGNVFSKRGSTPIGDDPNDILIKDFGIRSLLGKEGLEKWERYIELKVLISRVDDPLEKRKLMEEFMQIGMDYNFGKSPY